MKIMDSAWIRFCVLAMMTSLTYSTKYKTGDNHQQLLSKLSSQIEESSRYIDISISVLGINFRQHRQFIIDAISNIDQVFQRQLNTSVILSNLQIIQPVSLSESSTLLSFGSFINNSASDSEFLIRFSSTSSVESTYDTMCSNPFTGGIVNVTTMDNIDDFTRQIMYGLGRNLGFDDFKNISDICTCNTQYSCMMSDWIPPTVSYRNLSNIKVSDCNVKKFNLRQNSCLNDRPTELPDAGTCGNGFVEAGEECDCLPDDLECNSCLGSTCVVCPTGRCCRHCQLILECNSRDCVCKDKIGKGAVAASSECLDQLDVASALPCGTAKNCSILECNFVICRADDENFTVPESRKISNASITGSSMCNNLYFVEIPNVNSFSSDGITCRDNGRCNSGECQPNLCFDRNGGICSKNGKCDKNANKCLCNCNWTGHLCDIPNINNRCHTDNPDKPMGVQTTHIIAVFFGILFAAAVISGATSFGYKRLQKRNRLQTKHERNMLSLFEPTKDQKRRLARQYKKRTDDFQYNERYRIPTDTNVEQRLMDEGMPPPILCTAVKHSARDVSVI